LGIHAHNLFLHQTGEVGLFGGIAYAAMWGFGLIAGWKEETVRPSERNPPAGGFYALIVIVVMGFGENMFLDSVFWPRARLHSVAWILLGLIVAAWSRRVRRA
jgi:O-antigen ligase